MNSSRKATVSLLRINLVRHKFGKVSTANGFEIEIESKGDSKECM